MQFHLDPPLVPKNGNVLQVLVIDRISTRNQDPKSNLDQQALGMNWIKDRYDGPIQWFHVTGQGSGECIDRQQVREAEDLVASGQLDVVIMEDLGRHLRRAQAVDFCEQCEDHDTRLIAINDSIDTAKEWRLHAVFAAIKHEQSNKDTSERIKRTLKNRFQHGEVVQGVLYGYIKPAGTKHDSQLQKDPKAESIYDEWFTRLENGTNYSEIADWLNAQGITPGPCSRSPKWDCKMVARITHNPFLKGVRERNNFKSKRINKTGKRVSIRARPEEKLQRECPHLAFIAPARYDRVMRLLKERNGRFAAGRVGKDPRRNRPKKRTIWPGQHLYCGICRRLYRYGGHGQNDHLLCRGAYEYKCWSSITVAGPLASKKLAEAILSAVESLPDFDEVFHASVTEELQKSASSRVERLEEMRCKEAKVERELANVMAFVREGQRTASLHTELARLEAERDAWAERRAAILREPTNCEELPTLDTIKQVAREAMARQASEPYEFGRIMRSLIPKIFVFPVRLCDGGAIVLCAKFLISLVSLLSPSLRGKQLDEVLRCEITVDLFDPPQREQFRRQVMALKAQGMTERQIAKTLEITTTAVQHAASLDRLMRSLGLADPYLPVLEPPADYTKLRRHLHPRYRFEALPDNDRLG